MDGGNDDDDGVVLKKNEWTKANAMRTNNSSKNARFRHYILKFIGN